MPDAVVITCSCCERPLRQHCAGENPCGWWRCPNPTCEADLYDADRGVVRWTSGQVEAL